MELTGKSINNGKSYSLPLFSFPLQLFGLGILVLKRKQFLSKKILFCLVNKENNEENGKKRYLLNVNFFFNNKSVRKKK